MKDGKDPGKQNVATNLPDPGEGMINRTIKGLEDAGIFGNKPKIEPPEEPPAAEPDKPAQSEPAVKEPANLDLPDPTADPKPKEVVKDTDLDDAPKNLSTEGKTGWKALKDAARKERERAATLEKRVKELESSSAPNESLKEEMDRLRKERDEFESTLRVTAIERHPKFQEHFTGRQNQLLDQAEKIGGEQGKRLKSLLSMPDSDYRNQQLESVMEDMPLTARTRVGSLLNDMDRLTEERNAEIAKAGETYKSMQARQQAERQQRQSQDQEVFDGVLKRWTDPEKGVPVFQERKDDPEWNTEVQQAKMRAKHIFSGQMDTGELAKASFWAAGAPLLLKQVNHANQEITELKAKLAKLSAAQPGPVTSGNEGGSQEAGDDKLGYIDAAMKGIMKAGVFAR